MVLTGENRSTQMETCPSAMFSTNPKYTGVGFEPDPISSKKQRTVIVISVSWDEQLPQLHEQLSVANQTAASTCARSSRRSVTS